VLRMTRGKGTSNIFSVGRKQGKQEKNLQTEGKRKDSDMLKKGKITRKKRGGGGLAFLIFHWCFAAIAFMAKKWPFKITSQHVLKGRRGGERDPQTEPSSPCVLAKRARSGEVNRREKAEKGGPAFKAGE